MGDSEELQQQGSGGGTVQEEVAQQAQDPGTPEKDGSFLKMPPVDTDKGGKSDGAGEQTAVSTEQPAAVVPEAPSKSDSAAGSANIQAHPVPDLRPMTAAPPAAYPMVSPLAEAIPTPPATAPAAPGQLDMSSRPVTRGTLALPNRGFRGRFITRNGRVLTPSDMAGAVERLSNTGCSLEDLQKILAQYAHLPKPKTCWGKEVISTSEMEAMVERLYTHQPARGVHHKGRPKPVKLTYRTENGQLLSSLEPLPTKDPKESTEFLCELYQRCRDAQQKSRQTLADKYLQPLVKPKVYAGPDGKKKIMEVAQKLYAGESTR